LGVCLALALAMQLIGQKELKISLWVDIDEFEF
jgi:hypothetical protein